MRHTQIKWLLLGALALVAAAALAGCGGGSSTASGDAETAGSGYPNTDLASTRFVEGPIDRSTAPELEEAWSMPLTAESSFGAYAATPVILNGVIYSQDLESNVQAIDLESGDVLWTKRYEEPDQGPNGVVVQEGMVFGATPTAAFALDQESGKELWSTPLVGTKGENIDMAPGHNDGMVYVSTVPTDVNAQYPEGAVGVLWALDAKTGKKVWHFDTVPKGLWGNPKVNSGGGVWYPPSFDQQGDMYFGTGNPAPFPGTAQFPWGSSRPGPNLYTDSMVKLDAKTGKMRWYYQVTPHDLFDWDFQDSPILIKGRGRDLAIGAGKSGVVVAIDTTTGKSIWQVAVGMHGGYDHTSKQVMAGKKLPPKLNNVLPGTLGGVIAPMAANKTTVFVPVVNHPVQFTGTGGAAESRVMTGEIVAINVNTGGVEWNKEFPAAAFGAPTAVNDMVFLTTFDGTVHGLDAKTGGEVWTANLPAGSNSGLAVSGDTLLVPAGLPTAQGQKAALVAYRLGG